MYIRILYVVFKLFLYMPLCRLSLRADWKELREKTDDKDFVFVGYLTFITAGVWKGAWSCLCWNDWSWTSD